MLAPGMEVDTGLARNACRRMNVQPARAPKIVWITDLNWFPLFHRLII